MAITVTGACIWKIWKRSAADALVVCFRGGAFSAVLNLTLCIVGVLVLFGAIHAAGVVDDAADVPLLLVGYGFGASFVALFMQLGGGIYTKAADVGADLVGKVVHGADSASVSERFRTSSSRRWRCYGAASPRRRRRGRMTIYASRCPRTQASKKTTPRTRRR